MTLLPLLSLIITSKVVFLKFPPLPIYLWGVFYSNLLYWLIKVSTPWFVININLVNSLRHYAVVPESGNLPRGKSILVPRGNFHLKCRRVKYSIRGDPSLSFLSVFPLLFFQNMPMRMTKEKKKALLSTSAALLWAYLNRSTALASLTFFPVVLACVHCAV